MNVLMKSTNVIQVPFGIGDILYQVMQDLDQGDEYAVFPYVVNGILIKEDGIYAFTDDFCYKYGTEDALSSFEEAQRVADKKNQEREEDYNK